MMMMMLQMMHLTQVSVATDNSSLETATLLQRGLAKTYLNQANHHPKGAPEQAIKPIRSTVQDKEKGLPVKLLCVQLLPVVLQWIWQFHKGYRSTY